MLNCICTTRVKYSIYQLLAPLKIYYHTNASIWCNMITYSPSD